MQMVGLAPFVSSSAVSLSEGFWTLVPKPTQIHHLILELVLRLSYVRSLYIGYGGEDNRSHDTMLFRKGHKTSARYWEKTGVDVITGAGLVSMEW
ncbi:unnamed protein product [Pleuronectes platessa]|uniref:Uncharacterized protein n=1 Tax=Pleuronectes platessa TaxID=8262 RepID=A0A9N7VLF2_PLEPL|nr:unnamed protein product [Pleuronectes platessa]